MRNHLLIRTPFSGLAAVLVVVVLMITACIPASGQSQIPVTGGKIPYPIGPARHFENSAPQVTLLSPEALTASAPVVLFIAVEPAYGHFLVESNGMTLYAFTGDEAGQSNCDPACMQTWTPLISAERATGDMDVQLTLIGSTPLADGSLMVTYNDMPLYRFTGDRIPGDINGQGIDGAWFIVTPGGAMIP
jgi:predicted lipoprotein with Yx(FWY)xxD motif